MSQLEERKKLAVWVADQMGRVIEQVPLGGGHRYSVTLTFWLDEGLYIDPTVEELQITRV